MVCALQGIDYNPDANELVTFAMDNFAYVWDGVRLEALYALVGHTAEVTQVCHTHKVDHLLDKKLESVLRQLNNRSACCGPKFDVDPYHAADTNNISTMQSHSNHLA